MNYLVLSICVLVCVAAGFLMGRISSKQTHNFLSGLADLIVYSKKNNKSDEEIHQAVKHQTDIMLQGYKDFAKDPEAMKKSLQSDQKYIEEMNALIRSMQKTINTTKNFLHSWGVK